MNDNAKQADNELLQNKERINKIEKEIDEQNEQKRVLDNLKEGLTEEIDNDKRKIQKRIDDLIEEKNKKS